VRESPVTSVPAAASSRDHDRGPQAAIDAGARALVRRTLGTGEGLALAVSGGCDSMALMSAVYDAVSAEPLGSPRVRVLTFHHGTGPHADAAAALVAVDAARLGFEVRAGRAELCGANEAVWRAARWRFLRDASEGAVIATAHTRDDQIETVAMRVLRGAGARGLAGLDVAAPGVVRPFLDVTRAAIQEYARDRGVRFLDDPSNRSRDHLRNRVRLDLLPALERVRPGFGDELIALARRAALTRAVADAVAGRFVSAEAQDGTIRVARHELATYDSAALCVLWPAIAARARVTLDRRGTLRLAQFTTSGAPGARIQLSGGVEVYRHRDSFVIHHVESRAAETPVALTGAVDFGRWRFRPIEPAGAKPTENSDRETSGAMMFTGRDDPWTVDLPGDCSLSVRAWAPADRMRARTDGAARRVKRFFADAQVAGPGRLGWPVVLAEDEIVWIPGVRRAAAAPERSGRPVVRYTCGMCRSERSEFTNR